MFCQENVSLPRIIQLGTSSPEGIYWQMNSKLVFSRLFTEEEDLSSSLFLKTVRESDSGYYSCKAGTSQAVIFLSVIGRNWTVDTWKLPSIFSTGHSLGWLSVSRLLFLLPKNSQITLSLKWNILDIFLVMFLYFSWKYFSWYQFPGSPHTAEMFHWLQLYYQV